MLRYYSSGKRHGGAAVLNASERLSGMRQTSSGSSRGTSIHELRFACHWTRWLSLDPVSGPLTKSVCVEIVVRDPWMVVNNQGFGPCQVLVYEAQRH